jgi:hypothetical protein
MSKIAENLFSIQKAQIRPDDIKRLSSLDEAGIRGGIHSKRTYLMALHDGSLWIWKQTGNEERDEIFVYYLALKMFRGIVPEVQPVYVPKLGWGSAMRKVAGVPAGRVDGLHGYFHGNEEMQADLIAMLVLDYLTGNPDRHANNWFIMHNDRLAAIDNGWAGEDPTMPLSAVFEPANLANLVRDESLWPKMLKMMLALITDLSGRGDEARALAKEVAIDRKEAVAMVRLWEPKLQKLARFIQAEASKLTKEKIYIQPGQQPPLGVRLEEGPRGGRYYESRDIPVGTDKPRGWGTEEDPETVGDWATRQQADPMLIGEPEGVPDFGAFDGDVDELFRWVEERAGHDEVTEFFERAWATEVTHVDITRLDSDEDTIDIAANLLDPETGAQLGSLSRRFSRGGEVHHDMFTLNKKYQGQGTGLAVNRRAEEAYREMGFHGISLNADIDIGKYAWAQHGYDFADSFSHDAAERNLPTYMWENGGYDVWAEEQQEHVENAHDEEYADASATRDRAIADVNRQAEEVYRTDAEDEAAHGGIEEDYEQAIQWADDRRDEGLKEIRRQSDDPPEGWLENEMGDLHFESAWELAALDDGREYDGMPLGKAFMLSSWMEYWDAYKDLDPDSTHSRVGDVHWDKKKHKIEDKKKKAAEDKYLRGEAQRQEDRKTAWVKETLDPVRVRVRNTRSKLLTTAGEEAQKLRATYPDYGKLTPAQAKKHRRANEIVQEANAKAHDMWAMYEQWAAKATADAGFGPEGALPKALTKAQGRFPVELPAGSKVREGVTDEGAHDIDEDTDQLWREAVRALMMERVTEKVMKARTYVQSPDEAPEGARVETGPRGGLYYEGEPVFPGFERPPEHHAGSALLDDKTVVSSEQQSDIFIMALEELADTSAAFALASIGDPHLSDGKTRSAMKAHITRKIASRLEGKLHLPPNVIEETYIGSMLSAWAISSSDDNGESIAMQLAAAELFKVRSTPYIAEHPRGEYFREHEIGRVHFDNAKLVVQAMYDDTQEFFKKHDIKELVLFRGMRWIEGSEPDEVEDVVRQTANTREIMPGLNTAEITLHANPLSSWSYEPSEATTFANYKPDVEGTEYEGVGGYDLDDTYFLDQAENALWEEAKEADVDVEDDKVYEEWKEKYLADLGYYDVGQWAYSYKDIEPPTTEPPAVRAVMVSRVPAHKILATAMTGLGCLSENEIVALGGDNFPTQIYAGTSPDEAEMGLPGFDDIVAAEREYKGAQTPEAQEAKRKEEEWKTWADDNLTDLLKQRVDAVNQAMAAVGEKVGAMTKRINELKVQMNKEPTLEEYEKVATKVRQLGEQRAAIVNQTTDEAEEPFRVKAAKLIEEAGFKVPEGWRPRGQPDA